MQRPEFANGEYYHVFTHGVEDRNIFTDRLDFGRFLDCLNTFNTTLPVQSLFTARLPKNSSLSTKNKKPLVNIIAYCLNPNHYHMVLEQVADGGISEFMKRVNGGHAQYYNIRHGRRGTLYEGRFKARHIHDNSYLLSVSAYVNLNYEIHNLSSRTAQFRSSWGEYSDDSDSSLRRICKTDIVRDQFKNFRDYRNFAEETVNYLSSLREETSDPVEEFLIENN